MTEKSKNDKRKPYKIVLIPPTWPYKNKKSNMNFWNIDTEKRFFTEAIKNFASPEQLFYKLTDGYFAYVPKGKSAEKQTLQSRNSLIGQYTEKWSRDFFQPIAKSLGLYAVNSVVCPEELLSIVVDEKISNPSFFSRGLFLEDSIFTKHTLNNPGDQLVST